MPAKLLESEEQYDGHHSVLARSIGGLAACAMVGVRGSQTGVKVGYF